MKIEELKAKRNKAHDILQPIDEDGTTYEDMYHVYNRAFDILDEAFEDAIKHIKLLEQASELIELVNQIEVKN